MKKNENNRYREEELEEKELSNDNNEEKTVDSPEDNVSIESLQEQIKELKNEVLKCKANEYRQIDYVRC